MELVLSILGGTLLFIVLLVLLILFLPIVYEIEGQNLETTWAKAKLHWMFHFIRARVSYEDDLIYGQVNVFWKKFTFSVDLTEKKENLPEEEKPKTDTPEKEEKESIISKIKGMIERIKDIYPKLKKIITDEKNKAAVKHLKDEVIYLFAKVLLPKKSRLDAVYSTGSPDTTGQSYGVLACLPIFYTDGWKVLPDFEADEPYFKGSFWAKGKIHLYKILGMILRIVFDKNCQRLYTIINKFLKYVKRTGKQTGNQEETIDG